MDVTLSEKIPAVHSGKDQVNPRGLMEAGAKVGLIAPDQVTEQYVKERAKLSSLFLRTRPDAAAMMMEYLGDESMARRIEAGIRKVVARDLESPASGRMGYGTSEVGDLVAEPVAGS